MVEQLKYDVVEKLNEIEIRHYASFVIARVDGYGDGGFDILFRFITGKNKQKTKVKMTAPVIADTNSIAFVMPEVYSIETTPDPLDERIKIVEVPERLVAALRFSGRWSESIFETKSKELLEELAKAKMDTKGNVF